MRPDLGCERSVDKVLGKGSSLENQEEASAALPTSPSLPWSLSDPTPAISPSLRDLLLLPPALGSQSTSLLECLQKGQLPLIPYNVAQ